MSFNYPLTTRSQLVRDIMDYTGLPVSKARAAVRAVGRAMAKGLAEKGSVQIKHFGRVYTQPRPAIERRTWMLGGAYMKLPACKYVFFKPDRALIEMLNPPPTFEALVCQALGFPHDY